MRDSLGKDIEPYVLDHAIWGIKKKTNIMTQRNRNTTILCILPHKNHLRINSAIKSPNRSVQEFLQCLAWQWEVIHVHVSYFCKSCIWAKGWNKENFVFRLKCPRINSGKPAFCVVCPINNHQGVGHWVKYWCKKRCFNVIWYLSWQFILEKIKFFRCKLPAQSFGVYW